MATEKEKEVKVLELSDFEPPTIVKVADRESQGQLIEYEINESPGGKTYWDWVADMARFNTKFAERKLEDKTLTELQQELICQCLTLNKEPVPPERVAKWGKKCKDKLFELCQAKNGNTPDAVKTEGKDLGNAESNGSGSALPSSLVAQ